MIKTDIYPTRYCAHDNPGQWAVFTPAEDGTYRSCREDSPRYDRSILGAGVTHPGEMAVLCIPLHSERWPNLWAGFSVSVGNWSEGVVAECSYTAPDEARTQQNARLRAASIEEAMTLADAWIAERCS